MGPLNALAAHSPHRRRLADEFARSIHGPLSNCRRSRANAWRGSDFGRQPKGSAYSRFAKVF